MSEVATRFDALAARWELHCADHRESSNPSVFLDHPTFEALVEMGPEAVPHIIERYRYGSLFWGAALRRITGVTTFGDGVVGDLDATRRHWLEWWDAHQGTYTR
ncbi:hypothetical protein LZ198_37735 [Myxococcus sp. K15C18031901]|uniref:hypothetical protein n=1 Tax=Myxococcus dinghuensis TaxID=2906761 RepID=UPI0020A72E15|nr:hypothetical protein [Myxococcus dinghuensis]MCP3104621.1 hypothetical protein [Myxococcus dinghuensis]